MNRWLQQVRMHFAPALRRSWSEGYSISALARDALAGITVGIIALPLAMALAIASGVPPQHGLYTVIVAGAVVALLGGSRFSVTGPTAAFVVVLAPVSAQFGLGGLLLATVMAGGILILMGLGGMGRLIQFVPYPVTTGFTSGIAVVIAVLQLRDFFGLTLVADPENLPERLGVLLASAGSVHWPDLAVGAVALFVLIFWTRWNRRVPAPLVAVTVAALLAWGLDRLAPGLHAATIGDRFGYELGGVLHRGVPNLPPLPAWPWSFAGPDGAPVGLSFSLLRALVLPATTIAILGAIESLLCAVVADGMTGKRHDPDAELLAQGAGNLLAPFFGGIPATAAIARTAANIRAGAHSPVAAVIHALFVLAAVVALAPLLSYLPMAALAALLLMVAWNMSDRKHFRHILRVAPRGDVVVLLTCFLLTVIFDMVVAVSVGIVLAALLFMRRMAEITDTRLVAADHPALRASLPGDVLLYDIAGPLFFGAAEKAMAALQNISDQHLVVILDVEDVPAMDVTGLVALESVLDGLRQKGIFTILLGLNPQPARALTRAGIRPEPGRLAFCPDAPSVLALLDHET